VRQRARIENVPDHFPESDRDANSSETPGEADPCQRAIAGATHAQGVQAHEEQARQRSRKRPEKLRRRVPVGGERPSGMEHAANNQEPPERSIHIFIIPPRIDS
jgi:hypothetical protein